ncbi:MAG: exodeoxyribonuclease VII large subunit [Bdellovibrionales bacterium]
MHQLSLEAQLKARAQEVKSASSRQPRRSDGQPDVLSVSDVNRAVKQTLEGGFALLWIKGEISNFKPHSSGHWYFSLKDSKAQINAVMFRGFNQQVRFKPADGMEVIVRGKITVYEPRGNYQVFCEMMEPVGAGAMQLAFEQLKAKLQSEGLFSPEKKRQLPALPQHVAVVTSPTGAAIRDILQVLNRRFRGLRVTVIPAVVQGDQAPPQIVQAIEMANRLKDVDVLIVGRGGGSTEDMWCFNDERVARAIAASRIPTISAVGHEIDFTIADFVADMRAPTPSAAAELVVKSAAELGDVVFVRGKQLAQLVGHTLQLLRRRLRTVESRLVVADPKRRLQDLALRCDELQSRLQMAMQHRLSERRQGLALLRTRMGTPDAMLVHLHQRLSEHVVRLQGLSQLYFEKLKARLGRAAVVLDNISPLKVLDRGYAITTHKGQVVRQAHVLQVGDQIETRVHRGLICSQVTKISVENMKETRSES